MLLLAPARRHKTAEIKELAQKADALIQWMALYSHEFTHDEINEVFEANGIPYSADYHFMVEDGKYPRATGRKMQEYLNGFVIPESLKETLEVLGPIKERPTRRSERLISHPPPKDQAEKLSVLCDWCNDNEWFFGLHVMHQMDLFTENGIKLSIENLNDFNLHKSTHDLLKSLSLLEHLPKKLSQQKKAEIINSCNLLKKPRWARIDDGESPVSSDFD